MACCPPEALPYLVAEPATTGKKESVEGVEFYVSGPSGASAAILLFPDVWGWDSGRTRALADAFAEEGYRVYVPKLLQPPLEGGTDGDGLPPTFDLQARGADFLPWIKTVTWEATKPKARPPASEPPRPSALWQRRRRETPTAPGPRRRRVPLESTP